MARPGERRHDLADHAVRRLAVDVAFEEEVGGEPQGVALGVGRFHHREIP
jgi:hypothetical protein